MLKRKHLGSERMDCRVNSEYLASDSSRPLTRLPFFAFGSIELCPFDIFTWSLDIVAILRLAEVFGEQVADVGSRRLVILKI